MKMPSNTFAKSMPANIGHQQQATNDGDGKFSLQLPNWSNPALYKTRMCDHYRTKGECKFGLKCWFCHDRSEMRAVPRLDSHPEAALNAVNQVINSLPPSRSRKVAMSKSHQLYQELLQKKAGSEDSPDDSHREAPQPKSQDRLSPSHQFVYFPMPHAVFPSANYTIVSNSAAIRYENF